MTTLPMISYRQFDEWLEQGKVAQLVDPREPWVYEHGRLWGSMNIPYEELECNVGLIRRDGTAVFYCDREAKNMVVCWDLQRLGYDTVDLAGGMLNYRGEYIDRSPILAIEQRP